MATYDEIYQLRSSNDLKNRIAVALLVKASAILESQLSTSTQVEWAQTALGSSDALAAQFLNHVLASNKSATVQQIESASDNAIQNKINEAVDIITGGGV